MLNAELKASINKLWDLFWSNGFSNPITAIEQISYLIFMKRLDDLDIHYNKPENSVFKEHENCRWSNWKNYTGQELLEHVKNVVFPFIKNLKRGNDTSFIEAMRDAIFQINNAPLLQESISIIENMKISEQNQDTQGDIYEYLLSELQTSGKNGQFRTPRHIIRLMVKLLDTTKEDKILDPACGTGGFLINAYQHILEKNTSKESLEFDETGVAHNLYGDLLDSKDWTKLKNNTFFGYDNDSIMVKIGIMNMILHGIDSPNIKYQNALSKGIDITEKYTKILANPPFTGKIVESDINDKLMIKTKKTELLFVELMLKLLKIGGRCAVIVPAGVLFGSTKAHLQLRKDLIDNNQLDAVISMPSGIFKPYSGVSTAILVFTKVNQPGSTKKVWFYDMQSDGYTLNDKRTLIDGKGDIPDILNKFKNNRKVDNKKSFLMDVKDIIENNYDLSINIYKPEEHEETHYDPPKEIIKRIEKKENDIQKEIKEIKKMI